MPTTLINRKTKILAKKLGITSKTVDARERITTALRSMNTSDGVEIVFESGQDIGWFNVLDLPNNVHFTAEGEVYIAPLNLNPFSRFIRTQPSGRNEINGPFHWDAKGFISQSFLEARGDATLLLSLIHI